MTREHIEFVLSEYSTDALAGKLLELFDEEAASYQHTINKLNKALSENKGDLISRTEVINAIDEQEDANGNVNAEDIRTDICLIPSKSDKGEWIPFSKELPPKGEKVHVSTFGIVTIGERTSEANEKLRLSILEPMNNRYTNVDPYDYQITRWQPLPEPYKAEKGGDKDVFICPECGLHMMQYIRSQKESEPNER